MDYVWLNFSVWFCHLLLFCFIKIAQSKCYTGEGELTIRNLKKNVLKVLFQKEACVQPCN